MSSYSQFIWQNKDLTLPVMWKTNFTEKKYYNFAGTPTKCDITFEVKEIGYWLLWWKVPREPFPPSVGITFWVNGYPAKVYTSSLGLGRFSDTFSILEYVGQGVNWVQVELWSSIPLVYSWYMIFNCLMSVDVETKLEKTETPPQTVPDIGGFFGSIGEAINKIIQLVTNILMLYLVIKIIDVFKDLFKK